MTQKHIAVVLRLAGLFTILWMLFSYHETRPGLRAAERTTVFAEGSALGMQLLKNGSEQECERVGYTLRD